MDRRFVIAALSLAARATNSTLVGQQLVYPEPPQTESRWNVPLVLLITVVTDVGLLLIWKLSFKIIQAVKERRQGRSVDAETPPRIDLDEEALISKRKLDKQLSQRNLIQQLFVTTAGESKLAVPQKPQILIDLATPSPLLNHTESLPEPTPKTIDVQPIKTEFDKASQKVITKAKTNDALETKQASHTRAKAKADAEAQLKIDQAQVKADEAQLAAAQKAADAKAKAEEAKRIAELKQIQAKQAAAQKAADAKAEAQRKADLKQAEAKRLTELKEAELQAQELKKVEALRLKQEAADQERLLKLRREQDKAIAQTKQQELKLAGSATKESVASPVKSAVIASPQKEEGPQDIKVNAKEIEPLSGAQVNQGRNHHTETKVKIDQAQVKAEDTVKGADALARQTSVSKTAQVESENNSIADLKQDETKRLTELKLVEAKSAAYALAETNRLAEIKQEEARLAAQLQIDQAKVKADQAKQAADAKAEAQRKADLKKAEAMRLADLKKAELQAQELKKVEALRLKQEAADQERELREQRLKRDQEERLKVIAQTKLNEAEALKQKKNDQIQVPSVGLQTTPKQKEKLPNILSPKTEPKMVVPQRNMTHRQITVTQDSPLNEEFIRSSRNQPNERQVAPAIRQASVVASPVVKIQAQIAFALKQRVERSQDELKLKVMSSQEIKQMKSKYNIFFEPPPIRFNPPQLQEITLRNQSPIVGSKLISKASKDQLNGPVLENYGYHKSVSQKLDKSPKVFQPVSNEARILTPVDQSPTRVQLDSEESSSQEAQSAQKPVATDSTNSQQQKTQVPSLQQKVQTRLKEKVQEELAKQVKPPKMKLLTKTEIKKMKDQFSIFFEEPKPKS